MPHSYLLCITNPLVSTVWTSCNFLSLDFGFFVPMLMTKFEKINHKGNYYEKKIIMQFWGTKLPRSCLFGPPKPI